MKKEETDKLRKLIAKHAEYTKSQKAFCILANWTEMAPKFVKVMPRDYKRVLQCLQKAFEAGLSGDDALNLLLRKTPVMWRELAVVRIG